MVWDLYRTQHEERTFADVRAFRVDLAHRRSLAQASLILPMDGARVYAVKSIGYPRSVSEPVRPLAAVRLGRVADNLLRLICSLFDHRLGRTAASGAMPLP